MKCLFYQENKACTEQFNREHIIQEGLCGNLVSDKIICLNCNQYFSRLHDEVISNHYRQILHHLSPIIGSSLKNKKFNIDNSKNIGLRIQAGSKLNYPKIYKEYDNNGKLKRITVPPETDEATIKNIIENYGINFNTSIKSKVPISKVFGIDNVRYNNEVNDTLIQAILKNNLELLRYFTLSENLPDLSLHKELSFIRSIARNNISYFKTFPSVIPFAPVNNIFDSLFEESIFSHRFIINYDLDRKIIIFLAQYVNTMPSVFIIPQCHLYHRSFSFLYKKALLGGNDEKIIYYKTVLDIDELSTQRSSYTNQDEVLSIGRKYNDIYLFQYARAIYELDMRYDGAIKSMLNIFYNDAKEENLDNNKEVKTILSLIKNRYSYHSLLIEILEFAKQELEKYLFKSDFNISQLFKPYREVLQKVVAISKFGYPSTIGSMNISNSNS